MCWDLGKESGFTQTTTQRAGLLYLYAGPGSCWLLLGFMGHEDCVLCGSCSVAGFYCMGEGYVVCGAVLYFSITDCGLHFMREAVLCICVSCIMYMYYIEGVVLCGDYICMGVV